MLAPRFAIGVVSRRGAAAFSSNSVSLAITRAGSYFSFMKAQSTPYFSLGVRLQVQPVAALPAGDQDAPGAAAV